MPVQFVALWILLSVVMFFIGGWIIASLVLGE